MMRSIALVIGVVLMAGALISLWATDGRTWPVLIFPAILLGGLLCERWLYKPIRTEAPGAGWERTAERFVDPASGRNVAVYHNPRTGERRYVAE